MLSGALLLACCLNACSQSPRAKPAAPVQGTDRLNVLFIVSDDLTASLASYGHPVVRSPHVDRLAARGVRFDRAYTQYPLCNPSRASFLTGLRPSTTRVYDLATHFRSAVPEAVTLPQLFRRNGYFTARVGKIFHQGVPSGIGKPGLDDPPSWDQVIDPRGRDKDDEDLVTNLTPTLNPGLGLSLLEAEGTAEEQTDGKVADAALTLLEAHRSGPFFLAVGFYRPHSPWVAPKRYFQQYADADIQPARFPADDHADIPEAATWLNPLRLIGQVPLSNPLNFGLPDTDLRRALRAYYASVSLMDDQVGRLLDALDRLDLARNTVVVFLGDHGFHLGEHGLWTKRSLFEESARTPLIIAAPGRRRGVAHEVVELVDIYPTLAQLAALDAPSTLEGTSLTPLLDDPSGRLDGAAFSEVRRQNFFGRSVRTQRWRYTEWDDGKAGVELYDHQSDPQEFRNLASDPDLATERQQLAALLHGNRPASRTSH
jgi:uncharacterized sulfatase